MNDPQVRRELRGLESDRRHTELAVQNQRDRYANLLKGEMGKDIDDVLSGKVKVKLSFWERVKYKTRHFLDVIFNMF
jgi:hypothetical protein